MHQLKRTRGKREAQPSFAKNVTYSLAANLVSMILGAVAVLVLPKYLSGEEYGYYQLYLLYVGFTTLLAFGLPEGVYLALGGRQSKALSSRAIRLQFVMLCAVDTVLYASLAFWLVSFLWPRAEAAVFFWVCASGVVNCARNYVLFVLQAKGFIKDYSLSVVIERLVSLVPILTLVLLGVASMESLLLFDTLGRVLSFAYVARTYWKVHPRIIEILPPYRGFGEVFSTIGPGMSLMIATYASTMIIGTVRIGVESAWSIVEFAQVSLVISLANMLTRLINAVAIPVFPALKSKADDENARLYSEASISLTLLFLVLAIIAHPVVFALQWWLPEYAQALRYVILLVPLCLFESKTALLVMSFAKSYREEKALLALNVVAVLTSVIGVGAMACLYVAVEAYLVFLVVVLGLRCAAGLLFLHVKHNLNSCRCIAWDAAASAMLMVAWQWGDFSSLIAACVALLGFVLAKGNALAPLLFQRRKPNE